ncbi:MAG: hypothetical protein HC806_00660 [Anaerolineae bacterium]|nr:hypothetical protein [Anaerolineae bacterium]
MKKLTIIIGIILLFISCSTEDMPTEQQTQVNETIQNKEYNNLIFNNASFEKLDTNGNQIPLTTGEPITVFEYTTNIKITQSTFETNNILPVAYFKEGNLYSFAPFTFFKYMKTKK